MAEEIALRHHECWDGCGYPSGLKGEEIPLSARIVSVIDVFDSLTHVRPYKRAWTEDEALDEIERLAGTKFDPAVARAFLRLHGRPGSSATSESGEEGAE
jgi:putative two-component system response regulator